MKAFIPIDLLLALNQGLKEEGRLQSLLKEKASSIDKDLEERYKSNLEKIAKMIILTRTSLMRDISQLNKKFTIINAKQVGITHFTLISEMIKIVKKHPKILVHRIRRLKDDEQKLFFSGLTVFYFDYTETFNFSRFLIELFQQKDQNAMLEYITDQEFQNLVKSLVWEPDCISFAHGILEGILADLKKLKSIEGRNSSSIARRSGFSSVFSDSLNASAMELDMSRIEDPRRSTNTLKTSTTSRPSLRKKKPNLDKLNVFSEDDNSETLKYYRKIILNYIKDNLNRQQWTKQVQSSHVLMKHFKAKFLSIVKEHTGEVEEEADEEEWNSKSRASPLMWPYGLKNLLELQDKWAKTIAIDLANHLPPKIACLLGVIWNRYSEGYKIETINLISTIVFKEWLKKMLTLVQISSGAVFQMEQQKKQVSEYFINLLCDRIHISQDTNIEKIDDELKLGFIQAYSSLGSYVSSLSERTRREYLLEVDFDFQCSTLYNILPIIDDFLEIYSSSSKMEEFGIKEASTNSFRTDELARIKTSFRTKFEGGGFDFENIYLTFSKPEMTNQWKGIIKGDLERAEFFFDKVSCPMINKSIFEKVREIIALFPKKNDPLVNLLRDYLRHMDSNYLDAAKSYFKDHFTLNALLERDQTNKMFARVTHLRMNVGVTQYSAKVAVEYIVHKIEEEGVEIILLCDESKKATKVTALAQFSKINLDECMADPTDNEGAKVCGMLGPDPFGLSQESHRASSVVLYLAFIHSQNLIRTSYYQRLAIFLERDLSMYLNRYNLSFENSVNFGAGAIQSFVAYQFVEAFLEVGEFDICINLTNPKEITVKSLDDEDLDICPHQQSKHDTGKNSVASIMLSLVNDGLKDFNPYESHATTCRDLLAFLSSSKELEDFTTSGVDKRNFRGSLHKILLTLKVRLVEKYESLSISASGNIPKDFVDTVQRTLFDYMSSRIFLDLLSKNPTMRDFSFFMRCQSLNFIKLQDLIQRKDPDGKIAYMGQYLSIVTDHLKRMDDGGSVSMVLDCIEKAMTAIVDLFHVVLGQEEPPGSEDILPIFLFCLQRAKVERLQSIFYFIDLMMIREERRGKGGFNFTQIETGMSFIEMLSGRVIGYEEDEFERKLMEMEIKSDIHRFRLRKVHHYSTVENVEFENGISLL